MRASIRHLTILTSAAVLAILSLAAAKSDDQNGHAPPVAPLRPATDDYYGAKLTDPYRYMEDLKNPEVETWFKAQNSYTRNVLEQIPGRAELLSRIRELGQSAPARVFDVHQLPGGRYLYEKRLASEDVSRLYLRDGLAGAEKLLLDPTRYPAPEGSHNSISYFSSSDDGNLVAVGVSPGGSENAIIHLINVQTGEESKETIDRARFGPVAWRPDNRSFFYNRLQKLGPDQKPEEEEEKSKVFLHVIGTDVESDKPVLGYQLSSETEIAPADIPMIATVPGCKYAFAQIEHGVLNELTMYLAPVDSLASPSVHWRKLCDVPDAVTNMAVHGDDLYLLTHRDASRFKVVQTSLTQPDLAHARVVIPEGRSVVTNLVTASDALYVQQLDGGIGRLSRVEYAGQPQELKLPIEGAIEITGADPRLPGLVLDLTSWTQAYAIYAYDPQSKQVTDTHLQPLGKFDRPGDLVSEEVKVESYDGTMVPLSIVHRRDLKLDGSNPTLLDGYGAYGMTIDPYFDPHNIAWLEKGGVLAEAHARGGGEYGEDWHKAGQKLTKPNTWRDFIACAQYLVDKRYTSPARLAGEGTSAGGITIGRAITERPDLFAAAWDRVGVSNALRSEFSPNGPPNIPEFGSVTSQFGFEDLYAMDAYQHVRDGGKYPAVLLTTGWNDPRVSSWEPGKMTARLQAASKSGKPILLRVEYTAGHGMGSTKTQYETELADAYSFLFWQFGVPGFQLQSAALPK